MDEARAGVAAVLGTDVGAVALTHATTDGMNAATLLPDWRAGGRAVTTAHEHAGRDRPALRASATATASTSRSSTRATTATTTRTIAAFDAAITADTRLVSISHVLWTTGAVMPVRAIADIAHDRGALVVVDGAQAAGAIPFRLEDLGVGPVRRCRPRSGCSGPEGMGALVVDPAAIDRLIPSLGGWFSFETVDGIGRRDLVAGRPPVRVDRLPPAVGRRDGALDRLAVDVRRARLRLSARAARWPPPPSTGWPRSRA